MPSDFVHLHLHTEYSLLDACCKLDKLMAKAAKLEFPAIAMTDHGVMYGAVEFHQAAKKAGAGGAKKAAKKTGRKATKKAGAGGVKKAGARRAGAGGIRRATPRRAGAGGAGKGGTGNT